MGTFWTPRFSRFRARHPARESDAFALTRHAALPGVASRGGFGCVRNDPGRAGVSCARNDPGPGGHRHRRRTGIRRVHRSAGSRFIIAPPPGPSSRLPPAHSRLRSAPPSSILHLPRETRPHVCVIPLGSSSGWGRAGAWALGFSESGSSAAERELEQSGRANMCERTRK
jgi:hypothetical protein